MSDYPMLISNKLHSFRNFLLQRYTKKEEIPRQTWQIPVKIVLLKNLYLQKEQ